MQHTRPAEHPLHPAGYFSLNVPSGLTLYWFTNNILTTGQQVGSLCCSNAQIIFGQHILGNSMLRTWGGYACMAGAILRMPQVSSSASRL